MPRLFLAALVLAVSALNGASMTTLTIEVKNLAGKPVDNAAVIVKFIKGHSITKLRKGIRHEWDLRTNQEGIAKIPTIPQGQILVQIHAPNYQTFGQTFDVDEEQKTLTVRLNPPQAQYSAH